MSIFRRKRFSPENRVQAKARHYSKGLLSLYVPSEKVDAKLLAQKGLRKIKIEEKSGLNLDGGLGANLFGEMYLAKELLRGPIYKNHKLRGVLLHELVHFFSLGRNHLVTASAFQYYLKEGSKSALSQNTSNLLGNNEIFSMIDLANSERVSKKIMDYASSGGNMERIEHEAIFFKKPLSTIGAYVGHYADLVDIKTKRPGTGMILIRQISMGVPIRKAIDQALSGEYNKELNTWLKNNPSMKRILRKQNELK